jgi:hypothetical protein
MLMRRPWIASEPDHVSQDGSGEVTSDVSEVVSEVADMSSTNDWES